MKSFLAFTFLSAQILSSIVLAAGPTGPGAFLKKAENRIILATANSIGCAIKADKTLKCWGFNDDGELGKGNILNLGDGANEMGSNLTPIDLGTGRKAKDVAIGSHHVCAILDNDTIKCWGFGSGGRLGTGDTVTRGNAANQMGDNLPSFTLGTGRTPKSLHAANYHTCALLDNNTVKCWGNNSADGELGLGDANPRGDGPNELGDNLPTVNLGTGRTATQLSTGKFHTCALLDNATVKCWGYNATGQLGQGNVTSVGGAANQMGDNLLPVNLGTGRTAVAVSTGVDFSCALLDNGTVKCWGEGINGSLGQGSKTDYGAAANTMGDNLPAINLGTGRTAKAIRSGYTHTCALLDNDTVKCWGENQHGQLGIGNTQNMGDAAGEMGDALPVASIGTGFKVAAFSKGSCFSYFNCVVSPTNAVKCWGSNIAGELGQGNTLDRGDGAGEMGDNIPFLPL